MQAFSWMKQVGALTIALALFGGCAKQPASNSQAADDETKPAVASTEQPAAEPAPISDDQVQPATAVAPAPAIANKSTEPAELTATSAAPLPLEVAVDAGQSMPQVHFTEQHAKTCRVLVGDQFPKLELSDLDGQSQNFGDQLGEKLTVVVFWSSKLPTSLEELADMQSRFMSEFGEQGMAVIGVNVGDTPPLAKELSQQTGANFLQLSDPERQAFASVATEKLPRTYLLDASGKILWFDIEYSRTTRQQLLSALRFSMADK
ncbi:MAG: TlpA disulfide reductase family protein [Pirellulales bacterium]